MKAQPTRTLNPLPFQDLEPHRFEDLVRALTWDFRRWQSLEAIGRAGSDEGIDIRAIELVPTAVSEQSSIDSSDDQDDDAATDSALLSPTVVREWIIQCKREKSFTPQEVRKAVAESLDGKPPPHGFILAVACDLSKKARDAFRAEMVKRGVQEFHTWARGELEDLLLQAKNDRVLFAFFGISLSTRRESAATRLRSEIAVKRRLRAAIIQEDETGLVLLRDPTDDRYPDECDDARWLLCKFLNTDEPDGMTVLAWEKLAWVRDDGTWDTVDDYLPSREFRLEELRMQLREFEAFAVRAVPKRAPAQEFWDAYVPKAERAYLKIIRVVPYARVLAVDAIGDGYYPVPHVLVDWIGEDGPFAERYLPSFYRRRGGAFYQDDGLPVDVVPDPETRTKLFPNPIPPVYPPPPGFEYSPSRTKLQSKTVTALNALVQRAAATNNQQPDLPPASDEPLIDIDQIASPREFQKWREQIAGPVLATFVDRLRAVGHDARLSSRSKNRRAWEEELRFHVTFNIRVPHFDPSHRPHGVLAFSATGDCEFHVDVEPSDPSPTPIGQVRPLNPITLPTMAEFDSERIAEEALAMIKRVLDQRY